MDRYSLLITCEHAGNNVPVPYTNLFAQKDDVLNSHRGWDPGAWPLAEALGEYFNVEVISFFNTRLLIEPNRSIEHPELFSEYTNLLSKDQKDLIVNEYYKPYRENVESIIRNMKKPVLHLSVHTFTPIFKGEVRDVDLGLLFDPKRNSETVFCEKWSEQLLKIFADWKTTFNEPYKGIDDGFTTYLRTQFSNDEYLGIELEWNQKWAALPTASRYYNDIANSLLAII